jgi:hypothetical protein
METATPASSSRGRCLCGRVLFATRGPSKWVAHCHCTRCQRAHGAAFVTWAGFRADAVDISDPGAHLRWHVAVEGGSRGFCGQCGSPMFFKSERWPDELHIARALFLDPIDLDPQAHVFHETHVAWVSLADDLPRKSSEP